MRRMRIAIAIVLALGLVGLFVLQRGGPRIADGSVLTLPLQGAYVEAPDAGLAARLLSVLTPPPPSFTGLLSNLEKAARDPRIDTVVFRMRPLQIGWGKAQDLRASIARLREQGKHTIAYLEVQTYGANRELFVASACDEIVLAPGVPAPLAGLRAEYLFLGGLWERLGIELDVLGVGEYKSAAETLRDEKMSDPHREMANSLLDSIEGQFVQALADGRGLGPDEVRRAIDSAPHPPEGLVERKLVDRIAHWDAVFSGLWDPPVVKAARWAQVPVSAVGFEPEARFALVYGSGNVVLGEGRPGRPSFASDRMVEALEQAAKDPAIRAIVLRLDSPGGSGSAGEQMWRAVRRAAAEKPVVASMSDLAASAAYYVAAGANRIVAQEATYTGSIGVFLIRPSFGGLLDKLDVGHETLLRGEHADLLAFLRPMGEDTRRRFQADLELSYVRFVERVAEGRGMSVEEVDRVARGRVWTGRQARQRGLVDAIGGLRTAVLEAKQLVGLDPDADVELRVLPAPPSLRDQIGEAFGVGARAAWTPPLLAMPDTLAGAARWLADLPPGAPAGLPPIAIDIR